MKNSIHIPPFVAWIILSMGFVVMLFFVSAWEVRQSKLEDLLLEEGKIRGDIAQLEIWGTWTLDYVRISKAVDKLSAKKLSPKARLDLIEQVWQISRSYSIDPLLILAVVAQESHGNPSARGRMRSGKESGALGLMQIKLETAQKMAVHFGLQVNSAEDLFKPEINVTVGCAYLIRLIGKYGNYREALIAYNLGHSAVDKLLAKGEALPTKYYEHVISKYWKLTENL